MLYKNRFLTISNIVNIFYKLSLFGKIIYVYELLQKSERGVVSNESGNFKPKCAGYKCKYG